MVFSGRWTNGQIVSAGCLLSATVLVMVVCFNAEDVLFPTICNSCEISSDQSLGVIVDIDESRPLVQGTALTELENLTDNDDSSDSSQPRSKPGSKVSHADTSEIKNILEESEEDLTKKPGANVGKDVDLGKTQNKYESRGESLEIQDEGNPQVSEVETTKSKVDSEGEQKAGYSPAPIPPPPFVHSVSYYTKHYKHPVAELRVLTAEDGAPPLQSNISPPDREITIVTQTSADRLPALEAMCMAWGGAICVAVHVRLETEIASVYEQVKQMQARVEEQSGCRMDIQLVTEDGFENEEDALRALYPVNALRNVALGMANTKLIFLLDADFKPSPRLHESLTEEEVTYQDLLRQATEDRQLFVVPAFEVLSVNKRKVVVPETMEELKDGWEKKNIDCFHCQKSPTGHMPTKFEKFFDPATTKAYSISYRDGFEPYVIGALDRIPPYDARFRGYGENKVSHIYSCAADGMGFQVLPNVFVFELPHPASAAHDNYIGKNKDPENRYRIKGLYNQFQLEVRKKQMKKDPDGYHAFLRNFRRKD